MSNLLPQIMAEYDAMKDDGAFEGDHPILQMAAEIDKLKKNAAAISEKIEDAYSALHAIQSLC